MGGILLWIGIFMLIGAVGTGQTMIGVVGVILMVVGGFLFWQTSATKAYLDQNKRR